MKSLFLVVSFLVVFKYSVAQSDVACNVDGDCPEGNFCAAGPLASGGVCRDGCLSPLVKCGIFEKCRMIDNQPKCICSLFECDEHLKKELCATGSRDFNNRCEFETHNCVSYKRKGLQPLQKLGRGTCEEVRNNVHVESGLHVVL